MEMIDEDVEQTLKVFYQVERAGQVRCSDGGGPFGFDITVALLVHELVTLYQCDAVCETGSFVGDTTVYLARRYPQLPVHSCDVSQQYVTVAARRLIETPNAAVSCRDSAEQVAEVAARYDRPLFFLDAHWEQRWPLLDELAAITAGGTGVVVIHDFDIGHPRFGFDAYGGDSCGPALLAKVPGAPSRYFVPDPAATHALPCLQVGRRSGVGVLAIGLSDAPMTRHPRLLTRSVPSREALAAS